MDNFVKDLVDDLLLTGLRVDATPEEAALVTDTLMEMIQQERQQEMERELSLRARLGDDRYDELEATGALDQMYMRE